METQNRELSPKELRELNRQPSWFSRNSDLIGKGALAAIALAGVVALGYSFKRTPVEMNGVEYTGVRFPGDGNALVYFVDNGVKKSLINTDDSFNGMKEKTGNRYNVKGYRNSWGTYASSIKPSN